MNTTELIRQATADGVVLARSPADIIKATVDQSVCVKLQSSLLEFLTSITTGMVLLELIENIP